MNLLILAFVVVFVPCTSTELPPTTSPSDRTALPGNTKPAEATNNSQTGESSESDRLATIDSDKVVGIVTGKTRHKVAVVWSSSEIFATFDDGENFERILAGPGDVHEVAVDRKGRVIALRDNLHLGIHAGGKSRWQQAPFSAGAISPGNQRYDGDETYWVTRPRLAVEKGMIGYVSIDSSGRHRLALTSDDGSTWQYIELPAETDNYRELQIRNHQYSLLAHHPGDCGGYQVTVHGDIAKGTTHVSNDRLKDVFGRWSYTDHDCGEGEDSYVICALGPEKLGLVPTRPRIRIEEEFDVAYNGRHALAVADGNLVRLRKGHAQVMTSDVPPAIKEVNVDSRGRLLALVKNQLVRWSPQHGWQVLFDISAQE